MACSSEILEHDDRTAVSDKHIRTVETVITKTPTLNMVFKWLCVFFFCSSRICLSIKVG